MRNFLIGLFAGLVLATFSPKIAESARSGFDSGRELAGSAVQNTAHAARP